MKIVKFQKIGKSKYKLYLENDDILTLYEEVILNNDLILKKEINDTKISYLIGENNKYNAYELALKYISVRLRSKKEVDIYLSKKDILKDDINFALERLEKEGYLNDFRFAKSYLNDNVLLSSKGPNKIKNELVKIGISNDIINRVFNDVDYCYIEAKLYNLVEKKLRIKKGSIYQVKVKLLSYFLNLGYDKDMILKVIDMFDIKTDINCLKKEYEKLYNKYKDKYDKYNLDKYIESKLYSKGYNLSEILTVKNNYN